MIAILDMIRESSTAAPPRGASKNRRLMPGIPRGGGLWRQGWRQEASREGFTASSTTQLPGVGRRFGVSQSSLRTYSRRRLAIATLGLLLLVITITPAHAANQEFEQCVRELSKDLKEQGYNRKVVEETLAGVERLERIVELDRSQPESLQHFSEYLDTRVTEQRVKRGRVIYDIYENLLWKIYQDFGVSPRYLVALWGMETNYGTYFGQVPVVDAIVTLSCDERRPGFFRNELAETIALLEKGQLKTNQLFGSWAGAIGHTQFMPSTMRAYAIDYDASGNIELRDSIPDALASAANYLNQIGWRSGERWGREVSLSDEFEFQHMGLDKRLTVNQWSELGIRRADGSRLPDSDMEASLLLPMGRHGPAFLVYANFHKILRWNSSRSYALAVGYLADLIDGSPKLRTNPPDEEQLLDYQQLRSTQRMLNELGYEAGAVDGILGKNTRRAVRDFQQEHGLPADGYPDKNFLQRLKEEV